MSLLSVSHWCDVASPIVNGVVVAVESLRRAQHAAGFASSLVVPVFADQAPGWDASAQVLRLPSWPLPTSTGYRTLRPFGLRRLIEHSLPPGDIVHAHSLFAAGEYARRYARRHGLPFFLSYHTRLDWYLHYAKIAQPLARRCLHQHLRARLMQADVILVPTAIVAAELRGLGIARPIEIVPSGLEVSAYATLPNRAAARASYGWGDDTRVLLCVARLAPEKNLGFLLQSFARLSPGKRLVIIGDGPSRASLAQQAVDLEIADRILWLGQKSHAAVRDFYGIADAFVFTSESESQGLVLAEALAAGLPIAARDVPVSREILREAGAHFAGADPAEFARAIESALAECAGQPAFAARQRAAARRFAVANTAHAVELLYRRAVAQ